MDVAGNRPARETSLPALPLRKTSFPDLPPLNWRKFDLRAHLAELWRKKKSKSKQLALTRRSWTKTRECVAALLYSISGRPLVCHTGLDAGLFLADFSFSLKELLCLFSVSKHLNCKMQ